jgi:TRAP-type C4-dicarboxylate transport system permease small subunit
MHTTSHLLLMALFAGCVAVVGGVLLKDTPREEARAALGIAGSLVGAALVLGWVLYFFPL